jgi:threonine synthase
MFGKMQALVCRECKKEYPLEALHVCEYCFGPLEVQYDYAAIGQRFTKERIAAGPKSLWRYIDLLPVQGDATVGLNSGFTPLVRADRLAQILGLEELYIKNDTVNHPTLSFKDRVVSVALTRAKELGFTTVACASTGNLGNAVAAHSASVGLNCFIFIPGDLEMGKVLGSLIYRPTLVAVDGSYDDANRLCVEVASECNWAFVNINVRAYYSEGSKTLAYEIAEQLGWQCPDAVVVPAASGCLLTKVWKGFKELHQLGMIADLPVSIHGAQAEGCSPIATAFREGRDFVVPVRPNTIAKSIAIGNPADGVYAIRAVTESGGSFEAVRDDEVVEGMKLLAETEGIFAETAGGVTIATLKKLVEKGMINRHERTVALVTGNGLKTQEAVVDAVGTPIRIRPELRELKEVLDLANL